MAKESPVQSLNGIKRGGNRRIGETVNEGGERRAPRGIQDCGGVGQATVRLPSEVGVRVKATGGIGSINARNLRSYEGYYVNEKYGRTETQLRIDVTGGVGEINLVGSD